MSRFFALICCVFVAAGCESNCGTGVSKAPDAPPPAEPSPATGLDVDALIEQARARKKKQLESELTRVGAQEGQLAEAFKSEQKLTEEEKKQLVADLTKQVDAGSPVQDALALQFGNASDALRTAGQAIKQLPPGEQKAALDEAIQQFDSSAVDAGVPAQPGSTEPPSNALKDILSQAGPLAAAGACLALGGGAPLCMMVMSVFADLFQGKPETQEELAKRQRYVTAGMRVLGENCDSKCVQENLGNLGLTPEELQKLLARVKKDPSMPSALREVASAAEQLPDAKKCLAGFMANAKTAENLRRNSCKPLLKRLNLGEEKIADIVNCLDDASVPKDDSGRALCLLRAGAK
jgi:hypothetical protein